ncbi:lysophosphatidylcholine acyltransferase-like isoform X2 [Argiope bruennichi]|nr:lysophosphatidylcholine acyltransferase-like isoform X2 [Argiope bruennichi]XP_055931130.1 lysophosphatidylcholine acyltransferase-like isoform X2 [Argiope bruennichi]XP_055931131.1 lysophosphatidylcholine acyltransferase-like isoform X2 [Argiope bruennichi]
MEEKQQQVATVDVINPFVLKQELSQLQIFKSVILSVILLPVRFLLMMLILLIAWLIGVSTLRGISQEQAEGKEPLIGWRRRWAKPLIANLARFVFVVGGWFWIPQKGRRATAKEAPILLVMPHSSFLDTILVIALRCPSMVVKDSTERTPVFGSLVKYTQPLFVTSEDPDSRREIAEKIRERVTSCKDFEQLLLFPEGGCGNRKALLRFKLGAFAPGVPVQPVFIRYKNNLDTITWSWEGPGALKQLWLTLTQFYISCELEFLPVYLPSEQERQNPRLFADNVQQFVSNWTNMPVSDFCLEDARFLKVAKDRGLPPTVALVKLLRLRKTLGNQDMSPEDELKQLEEKRKSFAPLRGDIQHLASYLGLERSPEALKEFFRILDQERKNSLDVRVYDIGLWMIRTDVKMKEKMQKAFQILDGKSENLDIIALYWKGIKSLKTLKATDKFDPEELSSN